MTDPWTPERPRHLESAAVAWLADRCEYLDPARADAGTELFARKALVEVALLVGLRARQDPAPLEEPYRRLLSVLREVTARRSYRDLMGRDRRALLLYAGSYAALRLCGHDDPALGHAIRQCVAGRYATSFERVPYRHLDLLHTLELAGIRCPAPSLDEALPLTLLVANPNALELSTADTYAITHAVFYASDFGRREIRWPAGTTTASVTRLLDECLLLARADEDADLVGELLICLTCLGAGPSAQRDATRRWLQRWQQPDGRLEGPAGVVPERLVRADAAWGAWATAYHTTIVAALDDLLRRTDTRAGHDRPPEVAPPCRPGPAPHVAAAPHLMLRAETIRGATAWLHRHAEPADLRALVWTAEGWLACGDPARARATVRAAGGLPDLPALLTANRGDVALHLAELAATLGVAHPALAEILDQADHTLRQVDPGDTGYDTARARLAAARGRQLRPAGVTAVLSRRAPGGGPAALSPHDPAGGSDERRARSLRACADLASRGSQPRLTRSLSAELLRMFASAARRAVAEYDLGWLAVLIRGLVRVGSAPTRLVDDAADFLAGQQRLDGAIGAALSDDDAVAGATQYGWTLLALPALLEAARTPEHASADPRHAPGAPPAGAGSVGTGGNPSAAAARRSRPSNAAISERSETADRGVRPVASC